MEVGTVVLPEKGQDPHNYKFGGKTKFLLQMGKHSNRDKRYLNFISVFIIQYISNNCTHSNCYYKVA